VGRYLELDPIALRGGFNGPLSPVWFAYAESHPLIHTDPLGLQSELAWQLARNRVARWIVDLFAEWTIGNAAAAVCVDYACKAGARKDYFAAYGDCLRIVVREFGLPPGTPHSTDVYVNSCAKQCQAITHSQKFDDHCLSHDCW
jgi:hypothetical protein